MFYVTALALLVGAFVSIVRGGQPANIGRHRLRFWWLVVVGFGLQAAADRLNSNSLATVMVLIGATTLLAFAALNPHLSGIGVVAIGVAVNALVIGVNDGMPVRPRAVVAAGIATPLTEPLLAYGSRHHRERPSDSLRPLADTIPLPLFHQVVSFGDLILAVGVASTVDHLIQPRPRHAARQGADRDPDSNE